MTRLVDDLSGGRAEERARILPSTTRHIAMLAYPGMYPLDLLGPKTIFNDLLNTQVHLVTPTGQPVRAGSGVTVTPDVTYASCPTGLDVLFVPGGGDGTVALMRDAATREFLRHQASSARWITSVCTGSLILGAAGLLDGYRATTHWVTFDVLRLLGATPVRDRVVEDRNRMTAAGVTAGLDLALTLTARLAGENYARAEQLNIEYDPDPPFKAGTPDGAGPRITNAMRRMYGGLVSSARTAAEAARR
jgi:transcriptional regulator GlxA family with amidase domain